MRIKHNMKQSTNNDTHKDMHDNRLICASSFMLTLPYTQKMVTEGYLEQHATRLVKNHRTV